MAALLLAVVLVIAIMVPIKVKDSAPSNDHCQSAREIVVGGSPVDGTLRKAGPHPEVGFCGGGFASGDPASNPVVWYKFKGTGRAVGVHTGKPGARRYSGDGAFEVFTGDCDNLQDVYDESPTTHYEEEYDSYLHGTCDDFYTQKGKIYYVAVGNCRCDHCYKDFTISLRHLDPPVNDLCKNALELSPNDSEPVFQNVQDATWDHLIEATTPSDYYWYESYGFGVWYLIHSVKTGNMTISFSPGLQDELIDVLTGECSQLSRLYTYAYGCLLDENYNPDGFDDCNDAEISFPTSQGVKYYIHLGWRRDRYDMSSNQPKSYAISVHFLEQIKTVSNSIAHNT